MKASSELYRKELIIRGMVQGVGFRYFTLQEARRYGICGRLKNLVDGTVRVRAEGENLREFIESLRTGSRFARVEEIEECELSDNYRYKEFRID